MRICSCRLKSCVQAARVASLACRPSTRPAACRPAAAASSVPTMSCGTWAAGSAAAGGGGTCVPASWSPAGAEAPCRALAANTASSRSHGWWRAKPWRGRLKAGPRRLNCGKITGTPPRTGLGVEGRRGVQYMRSMPSAVIQDSTWAPCCSTTSWSPTLLRRLKAGCPATVMVSTVPPAPRESLVMVSAPCLGGTGFTVAGHCASCV